MSHLSAAIKRCNDFIKIGITSEERANRKKICQPSIEEAKKLDKEHKEKQKEIKRVEKEMQREAREEVKKLKKISKHAEMMGAAATRIEKQRREYAASAMQRLKIAEAERAREEEKKRLRKEMGYGALHPLDLYL